MGTYLGCKLPWMLAAVLMNWLGIQMFGPQLLTLETYIDAILKVVAVLYVP